MTNGADGVYGVFAKSFKKDHSRFSKRKIGVVGDKKSRGVVLVRKPLLFLFSTACRIQAMGFFISDSGTKAWHIVRSGSKVFAELFSKSDNPTN